MKDMIKLIYKSLGKNNQYTIQVFQFRIKKREFLCEENKYPSYSWPRKIDSIISQRVWLVTMYRYACPAFFWLPITNTVLKVLLTVLHSTFSYRFFSQLLTIM